MADVNTFGSVDRLLLTVVVPMYNEADCARETLSALNLAIAPLRPGVEIVAVDDGSTDATHGILKAAATDADWLRVASHAGNQGKAQALRTGIEISRGRYIAFLDADLQYSPRDVLRMLSLAQSEGWDVITGTRNNERYRRERFV
ncbi:MAG: glycosyltransferase family 2 protein, partial [Methanobacteriota archaeon]